MIKQLNYLTLKMLTPLTADASEASLAVKAPVVFIGSSKNEIS